ncbi:cell wall-anchored protein, partial [Reticulomyxa filosa]
MTSKKKICVKLRSLKLKKAMHPSSRRKAGSNMSSQAVLSSKDQMTRFPRVSQKYLVDVNVCGVLREHNQKTTNKQQSNVPKMTKIETPLICIELYQQLKQFDNNDDGYLNVKEFKTFLQSLQISNNSSVTTAMVEYFFCDFCANENSTNWKEKEERIVAIDKIVNYAEEQYHGFVEKQKKEGKQTSESGKNLINYVLSTYDYPSHIRMKGAVLDSSVMKTDLNGSSEKNGTVETNMNINTSMNMNMNINMNSIADNRHNNGQERISEAKKEGLKLDDEMPMKPVPKIVAPKNNGNERVIHVSKLPSKPIGATCSKTQSSSDEVESDSLVDTSSTKAQEHSDHAVQVHEHPPQYTLNPMELCSKEIYDSLSKLDVYGNGTLDPTDFSEALRGFLPEIDPNKCQIFHEFFSDVGDDKTFGVEMNQAWLSSSSSSSSVTNTNGNMSVQDHKHESTTNEHSPHPYPQSDTKTRHGHDHPNSSPKLLNFKSTTTVYSISHSHIKSVDESAHNRRSTSASTTTTSNGVHPANNKHSLAQPFGTQHHNARQHTHGTTSEDLGMSDGSTLCVSSLNLKLPEMSIDKFVKIVHSFALSRAQSLQSQSQSQSQSHILSTSGGYTSPNHMLKDALEELFPSAAKHF